MRYFSWAQIGRILVFALIGAFFYNLALFVESTYLEDFFKEQLLQVQFTLLGINIATASILYKSIAELPDVKSTHFGGLRRQVKHSIYEQIVMIALTFLVLTLSGSVQILKLVPDFTKYSGMLLTAIMCYELDIMRELFKAMSQIIQISMKIRDERSAKQ